MQPAGDFHPCPRTNAQGRETLTVTMSLVGPGTFPTLAGASFAGNGNYLPSSASGPLVITR